MRYMVVLAVLSLHLGHASAGQDEDAVVKLLEKTGAKIIRDDKAVGQPVIGVDLRKIGVTQDNVKLLRQLKHLHTLILDEKYMCYAWHTLSGAGLLHTLSLATTKDGKRPATSDDVHALNLANVWLTDAHLLELREFKNLQQLSLRGTTVADPGVKVVVQQFPELEVLDLRGAYISDEAVKHLVRLKHLQSVDLAKTKVTADGVAELQKALPKCQVIR
jgi:hypothetical protein